MYAAKEKKKIQSKHCFLYDKTKEYKCRKQTKQTLKTNKRLFSVFLFTVCGQVTNTSFPEFAGNRIWA